jgi:hypothetical protein
LLLYCPYEAELRVFLKEKIIMVIARRIAYNIFFNVGAKTALPLLLVGIGLITRYLGKEGFGNTTAIAFLFIAVAEADYLVTAREISGPGADEKKLQEMFFIANSSSL